MDLFLTVGDQNLKDAVNLMDLTRYRVPTRNSKLPSAGQGNMLKPGLELGDLTSAVVSRAILLGLIVYGQNADDLWANWRAIERKFEQARRGAEAYGTADYVCLWYRPSGSSDFVYFDVTDGWIQPIDLSFTEGLRYAQNATLTVLPYGRGTPIVESVSGTLSGGLGQTLYRPNVPGDTDALVRVTLVDTSTNGKAINRIRLSRRSLPVLAQTDFTASYHVTTVPPATTLNDASAVSGTAARLTLSTSWQKVASVTSASGIRNAGLFDIVARVRDASAPAGAASTLTATAGPVTGVPQQNTTYTVTSSPDGFTAQVTGEASARVTGLTNGTEYTFGVVASNANGSSGSVSSEGVTPSTTPPGALGVPGSPTNVVASWGNGEVPVTWQAPASPGGSAITGYTITSSPGGKTATTTGATSATVTGLTNGTAYTFTVTATNGSGTSAASPASNTITPSATPPQPMTVSGTTNNFIFGSRTIEALIDSVVVATFTQTFASAFSIQIPSGAGPGAITFRVAGVNAGVSTATGGTCLAFSAGTTVSGIEIIIGGTPDTSCNPSPAIVPPTVGAVVASAGNAEAMVSWTTEITQALGPGAYTYLLGSTDAAGNAGPLSPAATVVIPDYSALFTDTFSSGKNSNWSVSERTIAPANTSAASVSQSASATVDAASGYQSGYGAHLVASSVAMALGTSATQPQAIASIGRAVDSDLASVSVQWRQRLNSWAGAPAIWSATLGDGVPVSLAYRNTANAWQFSVGETTVGLGTSWVGQAGVWDLFEVTCTGSAVTLNVNGIQLASVPESSTLSEFAFIASVSNPLSAAGASQNVDLAIARVFVAGGFIGGASIINQAITSTWTPGTGLSAQTLYWQKDSGAWHAVSLSSGTNSYIHVDPTIGDVVALPLSPPPTGLAQLRALVGLSTSSTLAPVLICPPVSTLLGASRWETVLLATSPLPPIARQDGSAALAWQIVIEAMSGGTNTPTLDIDAVWILPHDEPQCSAAVPLAANTAPLTWIIDTRRDLRPSALLLSAPGGSVEGQAEVIAPFTLGPGDNLITILADVSDGQGNLVSDIVDTSFTVQLRIVPRYTFARGQP